MKHKDILHVVILQRLKLSGFPGLCVLSVAFWWDANVYMQFNSLLTRDLFLYAGEIFLFNF